MPFLGSQTRDGVIELLDVPPNRYLHPRLSPDENGVAVQAGNNESNSDIWVYDLSGETAMRQLTQGGNNTHPIWTRDGERLTFASTRDGATSIYWQPAGGVGEAQRLTTAEEGNIHWPGSWSPDGRVLAFTEVFPNGDQNIRTLSLDEGDEPQLFLWPYRFPSGQSYVLAGRDVVGLLVQRRRE